jgi:hypothetical protein
MTRKPKWQEKVEATIERELEAKPAPVAPPVVEERAPDFLWSGEPVYRCRVCGDRYERRGNLESVLKHEAEEHGPTVRPSAILGTDGKPLTVLEA